MQCSESVKAKCLQDESWQVFVLVGTCWELQLILMAIPKNTKLKIVQKRYELSPYDLFSAHIYLFNLNVFYFVFMNGKSLKGILILIL